MPIKLRAVCQFGQWAEWSAIGGEQRLAIPHFIGHWAHLEAGSDGPRGGRGNMALNIQPRLKMQSHGGSCPVCRLLVRRIWWINGFHFYFRGRIQMWNDPDHMSVVVLKLRFGTPSGVKRNLRGVTGWLMRTNKNSRVTLSQALFPKSVFFFPLRASTNDSTLSCTFPIRWADIWKPFFKSLKLQYHLPTTKRRTPEPRPWFHSIIDILR